MEFGFENCVGTLIKQWLGIGQHSSITDSDMSRAACAWFWNAFFGFEDAVVENLFIVLQAQFIVLQAHHNDCDTDKVWM